MIIKTKEHGETVLFQKGREEPLYIPITKITNTAELMVMVDKYYEELPDIFHSVILVAGVIKSEHPHTALEAACTAIVQLIGLINKDPIAISGVVLVVMYDRYKRSLTMMLAKLKYQLDPDTLISEQVGNA